MPGQQEKQDRLRRLLCDTETELSRDDLERMLEDELSRPEDQLNTALISEIVTQLEEGTSAQEQEAAWRATAQQLETQARERANPAIGWFARIAAVLAIVMGMLVTTYKTAEAFNWQLVLRLMRPMAETFMLYTGMRPEATEQLVPLAEPTEEAYVDCGKGNDAWEYTSPGDAPGSLMGYPVMPRGIPERFVYLQGSGYSDDLNLSVTHVYAGEGGMCVFSVLILRDDRVTSSQLYERTQDETEEMYIAGCRVFFYVNSDDATMSASWVKDSAQYSLFGAISEEELARVVEATMENTELDE